MILMQLPWNHRFAWHSTNVIIHTVCAALFWPGAVKFLSVFFTFKNGQQLLEEQHELSYLCYPHEQRAEMKRCQRKPWNWDRGHNFTPHTAKFTCWHLNLPLQTYAQIYLLGTAGSSVYSQKFPKKQHSTTTQRMSLLSECFRGFLLVKTCLKRLLVAV